MYEYFINFEIYKDILYHCESIVLWMALKLIVFLGFLQFHISKVATFSYSL